MHSFFQYLLSAWHWLTSENGTRATVLLVFITGWYAWLTYRMAKAMNRQTRAQLQPILEINITVGTEEFYPKGSFGVKNLGTQPALIRHMRMSCHRGGAEEYDEYRMYERHLMTPNDSVGFEFDFTDKFTKRGFLWWSPGICSFNLWVVASDLSGDVTLTYFHNQHWRTLSVSKGMPWWVRRKFVASFFKQRYYRILSRFRPPKLILNPPENKESNGQPEELQIEIPNLPDNDSDEEQ